MPREGGIEPYVRVVHMDGTHALLAVWVVPLMCVTCGQLSMAP
jgi:hypothetical protein